MPKNNEFANKVKNSSHVSTSAHDTGKESPFENAKLTGYLSATVPLNPRYEYCWIGAVGDCLDSPDNPRPIKDGDKLLVHEIPLTEIEILMATRKTVCLVLKTGECYVKQLLFADFISRSLTLRMYNPLKKLYLSLDKIRAIFVVDDVVDNEYMTQHQKPIAGKCGFQDNDLVEMPGTQESTTYLNADSIEALKHIFPDEATYIEHVKTLWVLRDLAEKACELPNRKGLEYDINSPYFRIVRLTNDLIGAILQDGHHFTFDGEQIRHFNYGKH
ncbi:hypothetical protein [Bacteroides sp.]|uniref:hypothetical protein n=1 Tax=Bacteroides sp. TaxID=29523 RepID=UPI002629C5AE|nr:hypothetical protein [Bacteroides sp.]MDD3040198.1 hypothetical protein [Bacteroides sp.]